MEFQLHPNLLNHLVDRQAATPEKAVIELVMNAADAGATRVDITLTADGFEIHDNGRGFRSEDDIRAYFATFGAPQEEDKIYGRYRVGRAQIFGWARTTWQSNAFEMTVDLANDQRGFALGRLESPRPGCHIVGHWNHRADELGGVSVDQLSGNLTQALLFPPVEVWINGKLAAKPLSEQEWTSQTDEAYFRLQTFGGLRLYNQGVFVCAFPHSQFHVGGLVVSKIAIELTMARNEPLQYSPGWQAILRHLTQQANELHESGTSVGTDEFRAYALRRILLEDGDLDAAVVTVIPKAHRSVSWFVDVLRSCRRLAFAGRGQVNAVEKAIGGIGYTFATLHFDMIERLRTVLNAPYELDDNQVVHLFLDQLEQALGKRGVRDPLPRIEVFSAECLPEPAESGNCIDDDQLTGDEKSFLAAAADVLGRLSDTLNSEYRDLLIAETHGGAIAYTDGESFIALSRRLVEKALSRTQGAITEVVLTYVHELCHHEDSLNAAHDDVFYREFHHFTVENALAVENAIWSLSAALDRVRPLTLKAGMVEYVRNAWWSPDRRGMSDEEKASYVQWGCRRALRDLQDNEIAPNDFVDKVNALVDRAYKWIYESNLDELAPDRRARRLVFAGPVLALRLHAPFDRRPNASMLRSFADPEWGDLSVSSTSQGTYSSTFRVRWGGMLMGEIQLKKAAGLVWKPNRKGLVDFESLFRRVSACLDTAFPWTERDFVRDVFWASLVRLTLSKWLHDDSYYARTIRVRRRGDAAASYFRLSAGERGGRDYEYPELTSEWRASLEHEHPGLVFLSGEELQREGILEFSSQAQAIRDESDVESFWIRWSQNYD